MRTLTVLIAAGSLLAGGAAFSQNAGTTKPAQPAKQPAKPTESDKGAKLAVGDPAPPFKVEKIIKGDTITGFEKGHVYVVEFWSTWCGPCRAQFPHLSAMQKQYKDKNVSFIGVNIWEDKTYDAGTLNKVEKFVKEQGDKMSYTVAYDGKEKAMDKTYMQAAGRDGIPSAFLVDGDGKVAWIGHPAQLESALVKAVGKSASTDDDAAKAKKKKDKNPGSGG